MINPQITSWEGCVHWWNMKYWKMSCYKREEAWGGGMGNTSNQKNIPKLKGSSRRKKLLVATKQTFPFPHVLSPHTVPSYRSSRRGPDCTRLCSSAPWKFGWSWCWSEGSLGPAEMKDQYYFRRSVEATIISTDGIGLHFTVSHKTPGDLSQPLLSLFIALIP